MEHTFETLMETSSVSLVILLKANHKTMSGCLCSSRLHVGVREKTPNLRRRFTTRNHEQT
jgi:hypothetical protein